MKYKTIETFRAKENPQIFNLYARCKDLDAQNQSYIVEKLGNNYKTTEVYPPKRKKFACPTQCGNTYVWINRIHTSLDNEFQVLEALCAQPDCGEFFLIYQDNNP